MSHLRLVAMVRVARLVSAARGCFRLGKRRAGRWGLGDWGGASDGLRVRARNVHAVWWRGQQIVDGARGVGVV